MSTRRDSVLDASSIGGVSDEWLQSQAEATWNGIGSAGSERNRTSFRDKESARASHGPRTRTLPRYYPQSINGDVNRINMADSHQNMGPPAAGHHVHQALQLPQALLRSDGLNFTLTGTLHPVAQPVAQPRQNPSSQQDLAKYTMRLMEYGQTCSEEPRYEYGDQDFGTHMPSFTCHVTIRGVTATGTGSQKRYAKHQASFDACQKLGLRLD